MKQVLLVFLIAIPAFVSAQTLNFEGSVGASAVFSSEEELPFWLYTNTNTSVYPTTNFSGIAAFTVDYNFSETASLEVGSTLLVRDNEVVDAFQRRDLYVSFNNRWLKATLGSRKQEEVGKGLSASNRNFIWSHNARPLPGILLEANEPIRISNTFSIDWGIGHYQLNDDRYVDDVRVHYKRLGLTAVFNENHKLTGRLQHFAQWAGTSPTFGDLPDDFSAFVDVFFARSGAESTIGGEVINALGNHLGTYYIEYEFKTEAGIFQTYHDHPFEDGSGTRLANFPDGIWGLQFEPANPKWFTAILYEYIDSSDQSGSASKSGFDGYFGNNLYRSGWSYEGNVIGLPFIVFDRSVVLNDKTSPYSSNRARVHHLGVQGAIKQFKWTIRSTYASYLGTYRRPFTPQVNRWSNYGSLAYTFSNAGTLQIFGGADTGNVGNTIIGGGLSYRYSF